MPTNTLRTLHPLWCRFAVVALALVGISLMVCVTSASAVTFAENRVGAHVSSVEVFVGASDHITAGQQLGNNAAQPELVVATGVAAKDGARLTSRTDELTGALDPIARNSRTSAVMSTRQGADVLAGGGRDLSPLQRALAQRGDVLARSPGAHAEITAMDAAGKAGLAPWQMAVSRPICSACQTAIEGSGGTVAPGGMFARWPG